MTPPTNLDCFADATTSTGYRFDCWEECDEEILHQDVCASDKGSYFSECHMKREACKMYGKDEVQRVTEDAKGACDVNLSKYKTSFPDRSFK